MISSDEEHLEDEKSCMIFSDDDESHAFQRVPSVANEFIHKKGINNSIISVNKNSVHNKLASKSSININNCEYPSETDRSYQGKQQTDDSGAKRVAKVLAHEPKEGIKYIE